MPTLEPVRKSHVIRNVAPGAVYDVVTDFAAYPRIFPEIAAARVLENDGARVRAEFRLQVVLPVRYVIDLRCDPGALTVTWTFVEGDIVTANEGGWRFEGSGQGSQEKVCDGLCVAGS